MDQRKGNPGPAHGRRLIYIALHIAHCTGYIDAPQKTQVNFATNFIPHRYLKDCHMHLVHRLSDSDVTVSPIHMSIYSEKNPPRSDCVLLSIRWVIGKTKKRNRPSLSRCFDHVFGPWVREPMTIIHDLCPGYCQDHPLLHSLDGRRQIKKERKKKTKKTQEQKTDPCMLVYVLSIPGIKSRNASYNQSGPHQELPCVF